jgi:hypothetical protein
VEVACRERGGDIEKLIANNEADFHVSENHRLDYAINEESKSTALEPQKKVFILYRVIYVI